ncbi:hypothetical protein A0O34_21225 [Chryseobacterium glaciei]|uniref:Secretion system C-terminal sorting domain-containing protein n=1 Tax=Chryseobacterium glaciei TaxID=1685010 RepID=A0A172Y0T1_9FLAO|nr:T9SS type A sorting domain-containing protein [Chryseobacterium glaciei]ANF52887.1 hypothetical protein A0O34_21225 [Chryseobacterium glaciei]
MTGGNLLPSTMPLVNGTTYYASQVVGACESTTRLAVTVNSSSYLSTNEVPNDKDFNFYPNPVNDVLHINSKMNVVKVRIYAVDGQLVQSKEEKRITLINMNKLIYGNYFVEFTFENGKKIQNKIIKK